jgi:hypothetical protein
MAALLGAAQLGVAALVHHMTASYVKPLIDLRPARGSSRALAPAHTEAAGDGSGRPPASGPPPAGGEAAAGVGGELAALFRPMLLADIGPPTHDPRELLARAERLAAVGLDYTLVRVAPSAAALDELLAPPARRVRVVPARLGDTTVGVQLFGLDPPSGVGLTLASGDVVLAVNGYPIAAPVTALEAYQSARTARHAVLEVMRGQRRLVFAVSLPADEG